MMDENINTVDLLALFDFNEQVGGGGGGGGGVDDNDDSGRYNCNLMELFQDDDDYGNTDLDSLYRSSETFAALHPLTYSLESRVLQSVKLHERFDFNFADLTDAQIECLEVDVIKYLKSLSKQKANDMDDVDDTAFNAFLEGTFNSLDQPLDLNGNLKHYYVIFCYLIYNLRKIESYVGFEEVVIEILNENSPENRILRRIRTCIEFILISLQRALQMACAHSINIKLPSCYSREKYYYDDSKGGIIAPLIVNSYDHLTSVIGIFFTFTFLLSFTPTLLL